VVGDLYDGDRAVVLAVVLTLAAGPGEAGSLTSPNRSAFLWRHWAATVRAA
jgi:hypothetical protein